MRFERLCSEGTKVETRQFIAIISSCLRLCEGTDHVNEGIRVQYLDAQCIFQFRGLITTAKKLTTSYVKNTYTSSSKMKGPFVVLLDQGCKRSMA